MKNKLPLHTRHTWHLLSIEFVTRTITSYEEAQENLKENISMILNKIAENIQIYNEPCWTILNKKYKYEIHRYMDAHTTHECYRVYILDNLEEPLDKF